MNVREFKEAFGVKLAPKAGAASNAGRRWIYVSKDGQNLHKVQVLGLEVAGFNMSPRATAAFDALQSDVEKQNFLLTLDLALHTSKEGEILLSAGFPGEMNAMFVF